MGVCAKILCFVALLAGNHDAAAFQQIPRQGNQPCPRTPSAFAHLPDYNERVESAATAARRGFPPSLKANARLTPESYGPTASSDLSNTNTRIRQSSVSVELPRSRRRFLPWRKTHGVGSTSTSALTPPPPALSSIVTTTRQPGTVNMEAAKDDAPGISKADFALFATYFCNMFVMNLSVVTVPALAASTFTNPAASAAFQSNVASMAPLGGALGKVVNGFVVQRMGGRRSSIAYLMALALLSCGMSASLSMASIGWILMGYEFLSSIQWTAISSVLDDEHPDSPSMIAQGVAILSLSSYCGALAAKIVGAALLNMVDCWRSVTRIGAGVALLGAFTMYAGITPKRKSVPPLSVIAPNDNVPTNPISVLKSILTSRLFWMIGIGHSLGFVIRASDRLLVPFLYEATGFSRHVCASLTSSVTLGFVLGLGRGTVFSRMNSIKGKMEMLKRYYIRSIASFMGLVVCSLNVMNGWIRAPYIMAAVISLLSFVAASSISFQFSQIPNLVGGNAFPENKEVALSLVDAAGFFVTSHILTANTRVLSTMGWSASWTFLALFLCLGSTLMMNNIQPVLVAERRRLRIVES